MTADESPLTFVGSEGNIYPPVAESRVNISPEVTETVIPSQLRIVAAKERRERLRVGTAEQEYISLSVTKRADILQGPHPESRLMREEDEIGEGDDGR